MKGMLKTGLNVRGAQLCSRYGARRSHERQPGLACPDAAQRRAAPAARASTAMRDLRTHCYSRLCDFMNIWVDKDVL